MTASAAPVRTCVGCRRRAAQADLLRVALVDGRPVADPRRRMPGRGGYVHPTTACVRAASTQGGFARAFRARLQHAALMDAEGFIADDECGTVSNGGASN